MTDISIIIKVRNEGKALHLTLERIYSQKIDKTFEIIIVDNSSTDNTIEIAKKFKCKILEIPTEKYTYPSSLNLGTEHAKGKIVIYFSSHCPPIDDFCLYHLTKHFSDPSVAAVHGMEIPIKGKNPVEEYELSRLYPNLPNHVNLNFENISKIKYTNGITAIRKEIWEKYRHPYGICYEKHKKILMGEDNLWEEYILKKRYKIIYDPKAKVYHSHKFTLKRIWPISYTPGYFSQDLCILRSNKSYGKRIINYLIMYLFPICIWCIKNKYLKALFLDFPLSFLIGHIAFYVGKRDRKNDERMYSILYSFSSNYCPTNPDELSKNPAISNTN
ncbi:MAG: hypothetical protein BWK75_00365 [Candidatus Altiarchaeales archaeon A3]|nr:MAG: hypothetical protein BWK75_00365 [Candidatus Altiarchaeales archaeon A3]